LFVEGQGEKISEALHVIVDGPQRADLGILQDPGVKNGEQSYLLSLRFQLENHLLSNEDPLAHSSETVRTVWLRGSHGGYILSGQCLQFVAGEGTVPHNWGRRLQLVSRLAGRKVTGQLREPKCVHPRYSDSKEWDGIVSVSL